MRSLLLVFVLSFSTYAFADIHETDMFGDELPVYAPAPAPAPTTTSEGATGTTGSKGDTDSGATRDIDPSSGSVHGGTAGV